MFAEVKQQYEQQIAEFNEELEKLKASERTKIDEVSWQSYWGGKRIKNNFSRFYFYDQCEKITSAIFIFIFLRYLGNFPSILSYLLL